MINWKKFKQLKESVLFYDDKIEFDANIVAPKSLEYKILHLKQPIINGLALAFTSKRSIMPDFYITAPEIGIHDYERVSILADPYTDYIKYYLMSLYDSAMGQFKHKH